MSGAADISVVQFGGEFYGSQLGDASFRPGLYGAIGRINGKADHIDRQGLHSPAGSNDLTGHNLGLYGTWLNGRGGYFDAVLQDTYYDTKSRSNDGMKLSTSGHALAVSLEAGQRIPLAAGLTLQPQAQVVHQHLKLRDTADAASKVSFPGANTALLRLGARQSKPLSRPAQAPATAWVGADLLQRVGNTAHARFSTTTQRHVDFGNDLPGASLQLQTGIEGQLSKRLSINARMGVERGIDGADHTSFSGQLGLKMAC
ncbi:autotransporter domain-containing protein [Pseudomonas aeruginosa]|nr:autotransporter domain-containing protein [Pseudomonas aeruginosa]